MGTKSKTQKPRLTAEEYAHFLKMYTSGNRKQRRHAKAVLRSEYARLGK